ncbi:MAG: endonuclease MutS2 [Atribacterota bacterium]|nr:endonuclease MutS2 [Atribacterota bacterium]MDD4896060.1 endonuclease MutS2 [Atribacterota bacterium]MDD5637022.1 endonuclease MutS2 [Atribacterota bacterium]
MNKHLFEVLDYFKIKELLKKELFTFLAKQQLKELQPSSDITIIKQWQKETTEMKNVLEQFGRFPIIPLEKDIEAYIKEAEILDSILSAKTLAYIVKILECFHQTKEFFEKYSAEEIPLIKKRAFALKYFRVLEKTIKDCINEEAEIVDDASPLLKKIRQKISSIEKKIRDRLENTIRDPQNRSLIQDDIITIRQGRYVIPVKQQEKSKFPGVIHDKSESGLTVFVEPLIVVEFNNELRELFQEEKKEEYRILQRLTALVGESGEDILSNLKYLGELDLINAKAEISKKMNAIEPKINTNGIIRLFQARHPLLKNKVVPIDIELGDKFDTLIITGPNTGGKTVTLKTVGLLNLMAQSGLHIPAAVDSEIAIFKQIFADIGDEQSIEQNLSTFSSHMRNIINILDSVDQCSLVLLDELGAGTDPSEGAALAMAFLDLLREKGSKVLSTTHHDSLKAYAYLTEGIRNARVEFDEKTLQPTFKISIGLPGKSCAFAVAQRLGLPDLVLKNAEGYLEREKLDLENLIKRMEKDRIQIAESLKYMKAEELEIKKLKKELEERINALDKEKIKIKLAAYQEAEKIIATAQTKAREIISALRKNKDIPGKYTKQIIALENVKKEIKNQVEKYDLIPEEARFFKEGDYVVIKSLQKEGIILEKNDKKHQYTVQAGNIKLRVSVDDIKKLDKTGLEQREKENKFSKQTVSLQEDHIEKKAYFKNEIDIRHMNAGEASVRLEKYLDDAFLLNISPVYIVHGKGKGILRKTVAHLLEKLKYIKNYRYGENYEGGNGVTVVYF